MFGTKPNFGVSSILVHPVVQSLLQSWALKGVPCYRGQRLQRPGIRGSSNIGPGFNGAQKFNGQKFGGGAGFTRGVNLQRPQVAPLAIQGGFQGPQRLQGGGRGQNWGQGGQNVLAGGQNPFQGGRPPILVRQNSDTGFLGLGKIKLRL